MFRVALVTVAIAVGVNRVSSNKADDILACMVDRTSQCYPFYVTAMTTASPTYADMCTALRNLVVCFGADLLCEGEEWDGVCYATITENYLEDTNVCGDGSGSGSLEEANLGKRCLDIMTEVLTAHPDPCLFHGAFAKCILSEDPDLQGDILDAFRETTKDEIRLNFPHTFGNTLIQFCPDWSTTYADLIRKKPKTNSRPKKPKNKSRPTKNA